MPSPLNAILRLALALGCAVQSSSGSRQMTAVPGVPRVTFDSFPAAVLEQVRKSYDAATANPSDAEASGKLAMLLDIYDRKDLAAICYQRAHLLAPTSFRWLYYLGSLQVSQGKKAEAAATLRAALKLDPDYLPAQLKLAEDLLTAGELDESDKIYEEVLKTHPDSAEARYGLGRILAARGDLAAAVDSYRKACELFPNYGAAHYALAMAYRKRGKSEEAQQHLRAYELKKNIVPPVEDPLRDALRKLDQGAASHLERGVALEQVGRLQDAIAETEEALRLDPTLVQAHVNLIILYGRVGDREKAKEHYQAAVKLNPNQFPDAYYNYGVLLIQEGKLDEAEKAFRQALEVRPSYADAHNNLGNLLERQGKFPEAIAEYKKAIESQPDFRQPHFNLGRILVNQQQYQEGIQHLQQTLTPIDENTPTYLYALGAAYGRAGDQQNALRYLRQARDQATTRGQRELVASIEKDLQSLEAGGQSH
jgi:tetratricopeptide (TPR) repeat protein